MQYPPDSPEDTTSLSTSSPESMEAEKFLKETKFEDVVALE
ncbi:hypothetical protein NPIL_600261, partial [Nephila pilipes]